VAHNLNDFFKVEMAHMVIKGDIDTIDFDIFADLPEKSDEIKRGVMVHAMPSAKTGARKIDDKSISLGTNLKSAVIMFPSARDAITGDKDPITNPMDKFFVENFAFYPIFRIEGETKKLPAIADVLRGYGELEPVNGDGVLGIICFDRLKIRHKFADLIQ